MKGNTFITPINFDNLNELNDTDNSNNQIDDAACDGYTTYLLCATCGSKSYGVACNPWRYWIW